MELLIELILEIVVEGILDGAMDGMESKKVPLPLRILCGIVLLLVLAGIAGLLIVAAEKSNSVAIWILLMTILAGLAAFFGWKVVKVVRKRKQ